MIFGDSESGSKTCAVILTCKEEQGLERTHVHDIQDGANGEQYCPDRRAHGLEEAYEAESTKRECHTHDALDVWLPCKQYCKVDQQHYHVHDVVTSLQHTYHPFGLPCTQASHKVKKISA